MSLKIEDLSFSYGKNHVLDGLSFELNRGVYCCLLGSNGVGKSTLFHLILKLNENYRGEIFLDGENIKQKSPKEMAEKIAYIPQSHAPIFDYQVKDVVLMSRASSTGLFSSPNKHSKKAMEESLDRVGIGHLADKIYTQISGGERQLVLIARALAQGSRIFIMDEPTSNLDYGNQIRILNTLRQLAREGYTILQSTHQPDHAFLYADRVIVLEKRNIIAEGLPKEVLTKEIIQNIYKINVEILSLFDHNIKLCIPSQEIGYS
ncbi:MAG: ABC transporter ATP-binding protein [Gallicola sp.]|nr:ABC transporter ATP-binding protein [Gallicola sp.]